MDEINWATPPRPAAARPRSSCVVCGLRAEVLICEECALRTESSIKWLEQLPMDARIETALKLLRGL